MRILLVVPAACVAIGGCASQSPYAQLEQQAKQAAHYEAVTMCDQPDRTVEWKNNCYKMVMYRRQNEFIAAVQQDQAQRSAAMSQSLLTASAAISQPAPQSAPLPRPVNCTSQPVAGTVYTNCR